MKVLSLSSATALLAVLLLGEPIAATLSSRTPAYAHINRRQNPDAVGPKTRYSEQMFIGTHHSAMLRTQANGFSLYGNQFHNITVQLNAGVRLIHGQLHLPPPTTQQGSNNNQPTANNRGADIRICHSSCALLDAGLLVDQLAQVATWLKANKGEVVTFLWTLPPGGSTAQISLNDLAGAYTRAMLDLLSYIPPHKEMRVQDWPTIEEMVLAGRRVVTFLDYNGGRTPSAEEQQVAAYLLPAGQFIARTPEEVTKPGEFGCNIGGSRASTNPGEKLVLLNHLLYEEQLRRGGMSGRFPNVTYVGETNAANLGINNVGGLLGHAARCRNEMFGAGSDIPGLVVRKPNFAMVDFFDRGAVFVVQDVVNGVIPSPVDLNSTNPNGRPAGGDGPQGEPMVGDGPASRFMTLDQLNQERQREKERVEFDKEVTGGRGRDPRLLEGVAGGNGNGGVQDLAAVFTFTRTVPELIRETEGVANAGANVQSGASSLFRRGGGKGMSGRGVVMGAVIAAAVVVGGLVV